MVQVAVDNVALVIRIVGAMDVLNTAAGGSTRSQS